jgi:hypothetical protein
MRMLVFLLVAASVFAVAQEKKSVKPAAKEKPMAMPMMKQSAEMAKLQKLFAGNWTLAATVEPMPEVGMNEKATSKGTQSSKMGPGGNSMIDEMHASGTTGKIDGHGVVWYDPMSGGYQAVWCDNQTPAGCGMNGTGKFQGNDLVFEGDIDMGPQMGGKMHMKESYTNITANSFTFSIDSGPSAKQMKHVMTIQYTRAKGAAAATTK